MIRCEIHTIKHDEQRYPTVGDYFITKHEGKDELHIFVSDMANEDYEFLVGVHELIEAYLCQKRGIALESIDRFDREFEQARDAGLRAADVEPGDDPLAPYYREHQSATFIERWVAEELGVDWNEYNQAVNSL